MLVSSIISAASRKVNKSRGRRSGEELEYEWSSRDLERSRDGGERLKDSGDGDRLLREDRSSREMEMLSHESDSQRSSHSDIYISADATPKSSRSVSKSSYGSVGGVVDAASASLAANSSVLDTYSSVKLRKDNARSSLDNSSATSDYYNNSAANHNINTSNIEFYSKDRHNHHYDNSRTSLPATSAVGNNNTSYSNNNNECTSSSSGNSSDSNSMLASSSTLGYSTPNILNSSDSSSTNSSRRQSSSVRPVSTYDSSSGSNRPTHHHDGIAIKSYRDLSANTQERIRRFEEETRAMLDRDLSKQRRHSTKLDFDKQSLEEAWQKAKKELEEEDLLDLMADNPTGELGVIEN